MGGVWVVGSESELPALAELLELFVFENMGMGGSSCVPRAAPIFLGTVSAIPRSACDLEPGPIADRTRQ